MRWNRISNPKNIEALKEFELPLRWYVDEEKTSDVLRDTQLLWDFSRYISSKKVVLVRKYENPEDVAGATENWRNAIVISGKRYIAKVKEGEKVIKIAVTRL